ncbi:hypothetical protein M1N21_03540 [Dehalococcoidia bacterium]|nr:hypothetical protein [Dehalococcoidia bacterium]MCL0048346.1 hypothetical protein [Dehalococcoidia bacterium]
MRRDCAPIWIDGEARHRALERVRLGEREFSEDFLQATLQACPELLPVEEFDSDFGPLVSLGREVDSIDNLFVAPSGKITLVETKLWRNAEATRQVVAQILDYAARVSSWAYQELEEHCRRALASAPLNGKSLYTLVQERFPTEIPPESEFVDSVQRSLCTGRFLLLIVGDGIREGLSALLGALHTHPRLLFTFGLVELQVFSDPEDPGKRLVVPHVFAHSTEIVRAVVCVVTTGHAEVTVELEDPMDEEGNRSRRRTLSEGEFLDRLPSGPVARTVRKLIASARDLGAIVEPRASSVSIRLNDPKGSKQKLTLFVITTAGELYTGWLSGQLESIGSDKGIAANWVASVVNLVPGVQPGPKYPDELSRNISVEEIEPLLDDFIERLGETIEAIRSAAG